MYIVRILNFETQEILEAECEELEEAVRIANVAYFSCGYDDNKMRIEVISENGNKLDW